MREEIKYQIAQDLENPEEKELLHIVFHNIDDYILKTEGNIKKEDLLNCIEPLKTSRIYPLLLEVLNKELLEEKKNEV